MLLLLTAAILQSTLPMGLLLFAPRRPTLPPPHAPRTAIQAYSTPLTRQAAHRHHVRAMVQPDENPGNENSIEKPVTRMLSASFPLAALPCAPGVYALINRHTGSVYVGESGDILQRLRSHRSMLERGEHFCQPLQTDFNTYGIESFDVTILAQGSEYADKAARQELEKTYISRLSSENRYNIIDRRGDRNSFAGRRHTIELRERLSAERKGVPNTALGRPVSIPPFRTRKGIAHDGGVFDSVAEASRVTGMARRDIRNRINDPLFPNWKEIDPKVRSFEQDNSK